MLLIPAWGHTKSARLPRTGASRRRPLQQQLPWIHAGVKEVKDRTHNTNGCGTLGSVHERSGVRKNGAFLRQGKLKTRRYNGVRPTRRQGETTAYNRRAGAKVFWGSKAAFSLRIAIASGRSAPRMGSSRFSWVGANTI
jgi:hypothetical protein